MLPVVMAKSLGFVPVRVMPVMLSVAPLVLLNVANRAVEVVPEVVPGKAAGAVSVAVGVTAAVPVPLTEA